MDHFNVTVNRNGTLISTRRGLQVSKQKHHGISFVNSFAFKPEPEVTVVLRSRRASNATEKTVEPKQFTFVDQEKAGCSSSPDRPARSKTNSKPKHKKIREGALSIAGKTDGNPLHPAMATKSVGTSTPAKISGPKSTSPDSEQTDPAAEAFHHTHRNDMLRILGVLNQKYNPAGTSLAIPPAALPTWTSHHLPSYMPDAHRQLFHSYFGLIPRKQYPFEALLTYNPAGSREFYYQVIPDITAVHCVLMCGAMFASVNKGEQYSDELAWHVAKVCSLLNATLQESPNEVSQMTLECIATLAFMGQYIGRLDHWRVHMKGLKKMIEMIGGEGKLRPTLRDKIRKTDLRGATSLATLPVLPFVRYCNSSIADSLPLEERREITKGISSLLSAANVSEVVCKSVSAQAIFLRCIRLAKPTVDTSSSTITPGTAAYDPFEFFEELLSVQHDLLCFPGPLRYEDASRGKSDARADSPPVDTSQLATENYISNHRARITAPVVPAPHDGAGGSLEAALRICCLLYHKELIRDFPRNLGGYSILLTLLRYHLQQILAEHTKAGVQQLIEGETGTNTEDGAVRRILLWVCLVGDLVSLTADRNEARFAANRYDRLIFRLVVKNVLGITAGGVWALPTEDFVMCHYLDVRDIEGPAWDDKLALARMLAE